MVTPLARCPLSKSPCSDPCSIACTPHSIVQWDKKVKTILEAVNRLLRKLFLLIFFFFFKCRDLVVWVLLKILWYGSINHLNWRNLMRNVKVSYLEGMRGMMNGMKSQQSHLEEHALLMEPSISDGHCKSTSFPAFFPILKWFTTEIVSDLWNCFWFMAILDFWTLKRVPIPGKVKEEKVVRCSDSSVTSTSEDMIWKQFSEIKLVLRKSILWIFFWKKLAIKAWKRVNFSMHRTEVSNKK